MAIGPFIRYVERGLENKQTQYYQEKEITEFKEEELARIKRVVDLYIDERANEVE